MTETVVITGASAGIGRATARLYGERGANIALIARGQAGLDGAVRNVEDAGGKALAIVADVADHRQVEDAARQAEEFFGPIDVWINVAFTSVFSPFAEITAEEFRRVTEVSYLGFVHGTMAALATMRPRGHGTIVQVGSALGARSIPLQSAYCGAKHAINGFTSALRCELMHEGSGVHVTVVQMPAVNTPQFSWVRSRLPRHPQPVPPIYQPEVAARGVIFAADHPRRRQYWVGASTVATIVANKVVPALLDRYLARTGYDAQQTGQNVDDARPDNLYQPIDGPDGQDHGSHGIFDARSHPHSAQLWLAQRPRVLAGLTFGAALATGVVPGVVPGRRVRGARVARRSASAPRSTWCMPRRWPGSRSRTAV
jgi:NAD(P)-dependent dehydrogenase (short-subunit alcohol dehydrogenase family)